MSNLFDFLIQPDNQPLVAPQEAAQPVTPPPATPQLPTDDQDQSIHDRILARFGDQFSPAQRAAVEANADAQKKSLRVMGGGALSVLGDVVAGRKPDFSPLEAAKKKIDEDTVGKFDADKQRALADLQTENTEVDRARKQQIEGANYNKTVRADTREQTLQKDQDDPNSAQSKVYQDLYRTLTNKKDLNGIPIESLSATQLQPILGPAEKIQQVRNANQLYGPMDAAYLQAVSDIVQGRKPVDSELPTAGVTPRALQQGSQLLGAAKGRQNTQQRWETLRGEPLEAITGLAGSMSNLDDVLKSNLPGWNLSLLSNRVDMEKRYLGLQSPEKAAIRSKMNGLLSDYMQAISGKVVSEPEARRLQDVVPNADDTDSSFLQKLGEFRNRLSRAYKNRLAAGKAAHYDMGDWEERGTENGWLTESPTDATPNPEGPKTQLGTTAQMAQNPTAPSSTGGVRLRRKSDGVVFANVPADRAKQLIDSGEAEAVQ